MLAERLLKVACNALKSRLGSLLLGGPQPRTAEPLAPGTEQQALQLAQGQHCRIVHAQSQGPEGPLEGFKNAVALGDQAAIELKRGQHPRRN